MLKRDANKIIAHIEELKKQSWLTESQKWWPDYLFHFTDIKNAVEILSGGQLLSRAELDRKGAITTDIANPSVISVTPDVYKEYVRLYFRPRTPTQYCNEGFRPENQKGKDGEYCPFPVVFMFDAKKTLSSQTTRFSNGCLATGNVQIGDDACFFSSLPFDKIYHDKGFTKQEKAVIKFHRHAEIIIPNSLDLSNLIKIVCRSQAEYDTLAYLILKNVGFTKWLELRKKITRKPSLFFRKWTFIEEVNLSKKEIFFKFNPDSETPGPFKVRLEIEEVKTKKTYSWSEEDFNANDTLEFTLSKMSHPEDYIVTFFLDDNLAYKNRFIDAKEIPF
ncbi:MAG: DUF4433 domain-containing protein [Candidatus Schekmanbacteria bacterium]|nr:DUF4433 domain-containing protein [Candidatus Schekmanbacteria bacterium]